MGVYIRTAMQNAICEYLDEDGIYYCEIPSLPGVWSSGANLEECRTQLESVLYGWIRLGIDLGHPIPAIDGVELQTADIR